MSPTPSQSMSTLRPDLVGAFQEFDLEMNKQGYIGLQIFPVIEVGLQSDNPGKVKVEELLFDADTDRAQNGNYNRGSWKFDKWNYATEEHGWEEPIDERTEKRYANIVDAEVVAAARAYGVITGNHEKRVAAKLPDTSVWTGATKTTAIVHEWDDFTNAVPIDDVDAAKKKVWEGTGIWPNALQINRFQFMNLRNCVQIRDRIASSGSGESIVPGKITAKMLAEVFDLEMVMIAGSAKNSAKKGQDASISQIWSNEYAMVCKVSTSVDHRDPCIGRTFHWSTDGSLIGGLIEEYYEERPRSRIIRVRHDTDEVVMYTELGHLLSNITT